MKRVVLRIVIMALVLSSFSSRAVAQREGVYSLPQDQIIPGRPWTTMIPDPDKFDWSTRGGGRPGYRYRGMLPMQQRFYDYIQQKRRNNVPLSWAEQATIRWLITSRRWPEAPRPNAFWSAFMRYLREQPTTDLNTAQELMLQQLFSRGLVGVDTQPSGNTLRLRDYLNSGPFRGRNWFERVFGRFEPWMDNIYAGYGYDLRTPSAPAGNAFPAGDPFNGLKIIYNVSGAQLNAPTDRQGFTISRSHGGVLGTGTLSISGTVRVGGFGADVSLGVWAGDKKETKTFYIENKGNDGNPQNFNLSVPIPAGARTGGFAIRLDGRYSMGGGHRGCYVTGDFGPSAEQIAADRAAADAKWRQEVEDTIRRLGYQNTPEGKEIEEMRKALAGGDAAWKAFVDRRLDQMRGETSPQDVAFAELESAMTAGGDEWERYVAANNNSASTDSSSTAATLATAQKNYDDGKMKEAAEAFTKVIEANPNSAAAYAGRGLAKRGLNDNAGAAGDINRALELDPNSAEAYRGRSMLKRANNDLQGAVADADRAVQLAPNNFRAFLTRGLAKHGAKDFSGAIADFNQAIRLNPTYPQSYLYRGNARLDLQDYRGALDDLNQFIAANQTTSSAYNNRGLAKERLGDQNGAIADYEKAISVNPNNETAKKNLANLRAGKTDGSGGTAVDLFTSMNIYGVGNGPTALASFTLHQPHVITSIMTYHWNDGRGTRAGTIALKDSAGRIYGPWSAAGTPGQGGVPDANWTCMLKITLPAGTYTIVDSEPSTWSQNSQSGGRGMATVKGYRL